MISSQPLHEECRLYLERLAEAGSVIWFSRLLELEMFEAGFLAGLKERDRKDPRRHRSMA
jgi:hypothetical protein